MSRSHTATLHLTMCKGVGGNFEVSGKTVFPNFSAFRDSCKVVDSTLGVCRSACYLPVFPVAASNPVASIHIEKVCFLYFQASGNE
jgi:hypothetical protein